MITRLEQEAAEEADAKAFCDKETSESKAKHAELKEKIKATQEQMAEMDAAQAEATALRNKEHEEYMKASTEYKESAEAVANAIAVLNDYYSSGSFVHGVQGIGGGGGERDCGPERLLQL